jgi:hypothetical protein
MQHHNPNFASSDFCCGSIASVCPGADHFRSFLNSGHQHTASVGPVRAKSAIARIHQLTAALEARTLIFRFGS